MEETLHAIVRDASPLVFAVVGETLTERAGVVNLSLDGSILLSALAGFAVAFETGSLLLGFGAAAAVGMAVALLIAYASIQLRLNQIAVGFVLFQLCTSMANAFGNSYVGERVKGVPAQEIPGLADIPFIGRILFDQDLMVYASIIFIFVTYRFMFRSRHGLALQGVGERPEAAHARGIPVNRLRYLYTAVGGAFVGIAGAAWSLDVKLGWSDNRTGRFGWIALAIVIFGGWHPIRAAFGAYLFAGLQNWAIQLQDTFPNLTQVLGIMPFPVMILTLVLVYRDWLQRLTDRFPALRPVLGNEPPAAIGTTFQQE